MRLQIPQNIPQGITATTAERSSRREAASERLRSFADSSFITVAGVVKGQLKQHITMKANPQKKSNGELYDLATTEPAAMALDERSVRADQDAPMDDVGAEMKRILDHWAERTGAILHALGIELDHLHGVWHPIAASDDLVERLSQIEIIPKVKANALKDGR